MSTSNRNRNGKNIVKYLPFIGLAILTIGLMIYFKASKTDVGELLADGKENIVDFYQENLQPLVASSNLEKEDVFNFALYKNIPIDKEENKILQLTVDEEGNEFYNIKPARINESSDNYEKFVKYLKLNSNDQNEFDSILSSYKNDLYASVLTNDQNTFAIDPSISILQKSIRYDIDRFAQRFNPQVSSGIRTYNRNIRKAIESELNNDENDYIVIAKDTVFSQRYAFDRKRFKEIINSEEMAVAPATVGMSDILPKINVAENGIEMEYGDLMKYSFDYNYDSTNCNVEIPAISFNQKFEMLDSLESELNSFTFFVDDDPGSFGFKFMQITEDSLNKVNFQFNLQELNNVISTTVNMVNQQNFEDWEEFGIKIDSLVNNSNFIVIDTTKIKAKRDSLKKLLKK